MIVPGTNLREARTSRRGTAADGRASRRSAGRGPWLAWLAVALATAGVSWAVWVNSRIEAYAHRDEARRADAIAVFGAAEYDGRPSPVLRARLDHALELYRAGMAPLIVTLGGGYPADDQHSEGGVGEAYLMSQGVPENAIIAETESYDTEEQAERLAAIARENNLKTIDVVSDGTHLFRIHAICERDGLTVYTSPRAEDRGLDWQTSAARLTHEILSYTAWRLHLH